MSSRYSVGGSVRTSVYEVSKEFLSYSGRDDVQSLDLRIGVLSRFSKKTVEYWEFKVVPDDGTHEKG